MKGRVRCGIKVLETDGDAAKEFAWSRTIYRVARTIAPAGGGKSPVATSGVIVQT